MDFNWTLMKDGMPTTPTVGTWLCKNLPVTANVGVDPHLMSYYNWVPLRDQLESFGHKLIALETNLIDLVWSNQPSPPCNPVHPLEMKYTGRQVSDKLFAVRNKMKENASTVLVLTFLDEIAWLLNLRGSDIEYNPVFFSYVIVTQTFLSLFIDKRKHTLEVVGHLNEEAGEGTYDVQDYGAIKEGLRATMEKFPGKVWITDRANFALISLVPEKQLVKEATPISLMKAVKNPVEIAGMRDAHIRDAVALCSYFSWLEKNVFDGGITELSGTNKLTEFRAEQANFVGPSFETISSVGPHGAIIHYTPSKSTDVPIRTDCIYLCDSGGQYKDGTTDVTRTVHFGKPTDFEKECFTRVLKGQIKLETTIFPNKIKGNCLDSFARQFLWETGLDYGHGTGHGIGSYLNVHEGPMALSCRTVIGDPGLEAGMFVSIEPGYYEDGKFGIRIEDIAQIVKASPPHNFNNRGFLTFKRVTLVPIQTKMVNIEMLTDRELEHFNSYHNRCWQILAPILNKQGRFATKEWLRKQTNSLVRTGNKKHD